MKNLFICGVAAFIAACGGSTARADQLISHTVMLDSDGKLVPWTSFGRVMDLGWQAFERIPVQGNGLRTYFTYSRFNADPDHLFEGIAWAHNPAGLTAMLVGGATAYYAYSGDHKLLDQVRESVDYQLAHGTTPSDWDWASVPFASSFPGALEYEGADDRVFCQNSEACGRGDGVGFIEPDKVGELGLGYLKFYDLSGEPRYLSAALACANQLARHVRTGDANHSPWPFRVDAREGKVVREEYTANALGPIALFDALAREGIADAGLRRARATAWNWLMRYPMQNMNWQGYFEDIPIHPEPTENPNQYIALETARYLMQHPELDSHWRQHARALIDWVTSSFAIDFQGSSGFESGTQYGAEVLSEQVDDMAKMGSHTSRFASVLALYAELTGDRTVLERAFRSLSWASYTCDAEGIVKVGTNEIEGYWFSDGYGDYMRHFQSALASQPDWAPAGEDHLLRTDSVIRRVAYAPGLVSYEAAHAEGREVLSLRAAPVSVFCGGLGAETLRRPVQYGVRRLVGGNYAVSVSRNRCSQVTIRTATP